MSSAAVVRRASIAKIAFVKTGGETRASYKKFTDTLPCRISVHKDTSESTLRARECSPIRNVRQMLAPATTAAVPEGPAPIIIALTAHHAPHAPLAHLLTTLIALACDTVGPLRARRAAAALPIAVRSMPSIRELAHNIPQLAAQPPSATTLSLSSARTGIGLECPAATARVVTRRGNRLCRICRKQLQKSIILGEISGFVRFDLKPALGARFGCRAAG
jgi:hypothetical protein